MLVPPLNPESQGPGESAWCGPSLNCSVTARRLGGPTATESCGFLFFFWWSLSFSSLTRPLEDLKPCLGINEISSSFFSLLLEILLLEGQASLPLVRV